MKNLTTYISISGENFNPHDLEKETNITLYDKCKKGDIGIIGRYKNIPIESGSAIIRVMDDMNFNDQINWLLNNLDKVDTKIYQIDNIILQINYLYKYQCNLEFTPEVLSRIVKLNINLCISANEV